MFSRLNPNFWVIKIPVFSRLNPNCLAVQSQSLRFRGWISISNVKSPFFVTIDNPNVYEIPCACVSKIMSNPYFLVCHAYYIPNFPVKIHISGWTALKSPHIFISNMSKSPLFRVGPGPLQQVTQFGKEFQRQGPWRLAGMDHGIESHQVQRGRGKTPHLEVARCGTESHDTLEF